MSVQEKSDEMVKRRYAIQTQPLYNENAQYQIKKKTGRRKQNFQYCIVHSIYIYIYITRLYRISTNYDIS